MFVLIFNCVLIWKWDSLKESTDDGTHLRAGLGAGGGGGLTVFMF